MILDSKLDQNYWLFNILFYVLYVQINRTQQKLLNLNRFSKSFSISEGCSKKLEQKEKL